MNVLAINPGHNGSAALVVDGKLEYYIEEERMSREKYDGNPFRAMLYLMQHYPIDYLVVGGTGQENHELPWTGESSYIALVRKFNPKVKVTEMAHAHHLGHAATAFYSSGFDTAAAIIVDGSGSKSRVPIGPEVKDKQRPFLDVFETESIYQCEWPGEFNPVFKRYADNILPSLIAVVESDQEIDSAVTTVKAYEAVSEYLGFGFIEAGKTMGLAPYGKRDKNIPNLLVGDLKRGDKNVLIPQYPRGAYIDQERNSYLRQTFDPREWHREPSKLPVVARNLAWKVQQETQEYVGDLIEKAVDMTGEDNIVISGGYGLNVMANYYYKERFPELNIFIDPISHDGGSSIGLAKLISYSEMLREGEDEEIEIEKDPLTTLYLGAKYFYDEKSLERYGIIGEDGEGLIEVSDVTDADVAQLLKDRKIVSIFQGRSEAGPRALGNRSILFDPSHPDGKDIVNRVKGREWFRPFAASVMQEHAKDWFDLRGMEETPYMMYAVELQDEQIGKISSVTHIDGTCRIQTVSQEQNENYYNLINEFYKLTEIPLLFNTSFNLAGEPLVETLDHAIMTLHTSQLEYLYLPELGKLVYLSNERSMIQPPKTSTKLDVKEQIRENING